MGTTLLFCLAILMAVASIAYLAYTAWRSGGKYKEFEIEFLWRLMIVGTVSGVPIVFLLAFLAKENYVSYAAPAIFLLCSTFAFASYAFETITCRREHILQIRNGYKENYNYRQWMIKIIACCGFLFLSLALWMLATYLSPMELNANHLNPWILVYFAITYTALSLSKNLYATKKKRADDDWRSQRMLFSK